jgi:hypothetical protein
MKFTTTLSALLLLAAPALVSAWKFEIFDGDCITSTDLESGTGDQECEDTPNPHECFRISEMGNCELCKRPRYTNCM